MTVDTIINILSFILPFSNEIANVLTSSKLKVFKNLYKNCIDPLLIDSYQLKYIDNKKLCKIKNTLSKMLIDIIALFGIILNIAKNSIEYGYLAGILSGLIIVLLSFIIPNLFIHKIIHFFTNYFKSENPYLIICIGFIIIGILLGLSIFFEKIIIKYTEYKNIDKEIKPKNI